MLEGYRQSNANNSNKSFFSIRLDNGADVNITYLIIQRGCTEKNIHLAIFKGEMTMLYLILHQNDIISLDVIPFP